MIEFDQDPYRLSGTVYGVLMNDPKSLDAIGDAVNRAPYKAAPVAPVLYLKPRNTLISQNTEMRLAANEAAVEINATIGLVFKRAACRVRKEDVADVVAGMVLVADLTIPHSSFYRPSVRFKARDHSCVMAKSIVPLNSIHEIGSVELSVEINGAHASTYSFNNMVRSADLLVADVTDFMTLSRGDILLIGLKADAVLAKKGDRFKVTSSLGTVNGVIA